MKEETKCETIALDKRGVDEQVSIGMVTTSRDEGTFFPPMKGRV